MNSLQSLSVAEQMMPSPETAAEWILERRWARRKLIEFTKFTYPNYHAEAAHEAIAKILDEVIEGKHDRVMVFAPPQHGKSELVSVRFPALWAAKRPNDPIIMASYAAPLIEEKSRQALDLLETPEYRALFPGIRVHHRLRSLDRWGLAEPHRFTLRAAGISGGLSGYPAMLGIVDDPVENYQQAASETYRDRLWYWWRMVFRPRIWTGGAIVLVMTRWHEDDIAGRLLRSQPGRWHVLRLPAIAETQEERDQSNERQGLPLGQCDPIGRQPGQSLCPTRFPLKTLLKIKDLLGESPWQALYQGVPFTPGGDLFRREYFRIIPTSPYHAKRVRYWDYAATEKATSAYTAGVRMAVADGIYYIEDVVRGRWRTHERRQVVLQTATLDHTKRQYVPIWIEQEGGSSGIDAIHDELRVLRGFTVHGDRVTGSKDIRLAPFQAQAQGGNVRLVQGSWNRAYIEEMIAVPNGKFRDQADATAGAFNKLIAEGGTITSQEY